MTWVIHFFPGNWWDVEPGKSFHKAESKGVKVAIAALDLEILAFLLAISIHLVGNMRVRDNRVRHHKLRFELRRFRIPFDDLKLSRWLVYNRMQAWPLHLVPPFLGESCWTAGQIFEKGVFSWPHRNWLTQYILWLGLKLEAAFLVFLTFHTACLVIIEEHIQFRFLLNLLLSRYFILSY